MDQATVELDPKKRAALYLEFQKLVVEAAPLVWVHELQFVTVYNKQFKAMSSSHQKKHRKWASQSFTRS